jgi:hypothetical protein
MKASPYTTTEIQDLLTAFFAWSDATFGTDKGQLGALHHLAEEVEELLEKPDDELEYADAAMLLFDAHRRAGYSWGDFWAAFAHKLAINQQRQWGRPDANGVVKHVG